MSEPLTRESAMARTSFSLYRKTARTLISDIEFPPGTTFQTPEGLRAEDEPTRAALDVQGGIYPIRVSVFEASYALDTEEAAALASPSHRFDHDDTWRHHHHDQTGNPVWWINVEQFGGSKDEHRHAALASPSPSPERRHPMNEPSRWRRFLRLLRWIADRPDRWLDREETPDE